MPTDILRRQGIREFPRRHRRKPSDQYRSASYSDRRAVATIECVLCLPLLLAITFATIDLCSAMFLKESLTIAAYEGARVGAASGGTSASVTSRAEEVLTERGIFFESGAVTFSDTTFDTATTLELVTITVSVPCSSNLPVTSGQLFSGQSLSADVTIRKEFANP